MDVYTAVNHETTDFYLSIARRAYAELKDCADPITLGDDNYSEHFRHAIVCSVFSAIAVEHALQTLIWVRCFLQTPEPYRNPALLQAGQLRTIPQKLEFLKLTTKIPDGKLNEVKGLFEYRNRIVHANIKSFEGNVLTYESVERLNKEGRGSDVDRAIELALDKNQLEGLKSLAADHGEKTSYLCLPPIDTQDLEKARKNLCIAETAVAAIEHELASPDWPLGYVHDTRTPKARRRKRRPAAE